MAKKTRNTKTGYETSIVNGILYFEDASQCPVDSELFPQIIGDGYTKSIRVISLEHDYFQRVWLESGSVVSEDINMQFTIRREIRSGAGHWYAYRRVFGKLHKKYVGTDEKVTQASLLAIAKAMPTT